MEEFLQNCALDNYNHDISKMQHWSHILARYNLSNPLKNGTRRTQADPENGNSRISFNLPPLHIKGQHIQEFTNFKNPGVQVDAHLNWREQFQASNR